MSYSIYGSWSIEEAKDVGKKFKAKAKGARGYENCLTENKEYVIEITPRILTMSPLCKGVGDNGKTFECHLERFEKVEEVQ